MTKSANPKVVHAIPTLGVGGAERLLVMLLPELQRQNTDVVVAINSEPDDLRPELEAAGVKVIKLAPHYRWNVLAGASNIARLARDEHCDVIHTHLYFPSIYAGIARMLGYTKARTMVTFHNTVFVPEADGNGAKATLKLRLSQFIFKKNIDKFIAVSEAVKDNYNEATGLKEIAVLHNPVEIDSIDKVLQEIDAALPDAVPSIVLPGRLVDQKGHTHLVKALEHLKDRDIRFTATFVGGGPLQDTIQQQIDAAGLTRDITITGMVDHTELITHVARATVVAIPSIYEGFGITAVEAMATRRPVVASAVGGLPEVLGQDEAGILVPSADPIALADALQNVLSSPELQHKLGAAGRKRAEDLFSLPQIARKLREFYLEETSEKSK